MDCLKKPKSRPLSKLSRSHTKAEALFFLRTRIATVFTLEKGLTGFAHASAFACAHYYFF